MIAPILEEVATEYAGRVTMEAIEYRPEFRSTNPSMVSVASPPCCCSKNGAVAATKVGALLKSQLKDFLDANI